MKYLLGIDDGGTFSKAAIFDEDGKQISVASVPTVTLTPKPGYTEKDLDELWQVNVNAIRGAIEKSGIDPKDIAGVSFSGAGKAAGIAVGIYHDYQEAIRRTVAITKTIYPRPEYKEIYEEKYAAYRAVIESLSSAWKCFKN